MPRQRRSRTAGLGGAATWRARKCRFGRTAVTARSFSNQSARLLAVHDGDSGVCLAQNSGVSTRAAPIPDSNNDGKRTDFSVLVELAKVDGDLRRLRQESANAHVDLHQRRSRVVHLDALLRADSIALAALQNSGKSDRVEVDVLDDAVAGARRARVSANESAARASESLGPLLERLSRAITHLEREGKELRTQLSPPTARLLDTLTRRNISPPVATLDNSACGECHVRLPTALANAMLREQSAHRCPHCKRILVPASGSQLVSAGRLAGIES